MAHTDAPGTADNPRVDHEESDVNVRAVLLFVVGLAITAAAVHVVTWWMFDYFAARESRQDPPVRPLAATGPQRPPEPRLQAFTPPDAAYSQAFARAPVPTLREFRAAEEAQLGSYGWIDRGAGVVRLPIDRAMDLLLERGLPPSAPQPPASPVPPRPGEPARPEAR
jgi:hypothetical protein